MKKTIIISIFLFGSLKADMSDDNWKNIGSYIVKNSDGSNRDLEAAKQMLLNIKSDKDAKTLANSISKKWPSANRGQLLALKRYPDIKTIDEVKAEGKKLFESHKDFINNTLNMNCKID